MKHQLKLHSDIINYRLIHSTLKKLVCSFILTTKLYIQKSQKYIEYHLLHKHAMP